MPVLEKEEQQEEKAEGKQPWPAAEEAVAVDEAVAAGPDAEVLIRETADLVPEEGHRFGWREVRVSKTRVSVHLENGAEILSVPMGDIKSARTEPLVGGARLELTTNSGSVVPVAAFTASIAARFSEMARGIEQLARGEELAIKWALEKTRCEKCGRLLPEKDGRCPA